MFISTKPFVAKARSIPVIGKAGRWIRRMGPLFQLTVLIPTILSIIYFGLIASDVYVSESRFVVRSPDKPSASALGMLLKGAGFSNANEELYAVQDYVLSRDALASLNGKGEVVAAYANDRIDWINRFNSFGLDASFEALYRYYEKMVEVDHDTTSSITTLTVSAYTARQARDFNERLLRQSEALVNRLNTRGRHDLIRYAEAEVATAEERARAAAAALSAYRNRQGVLDPERQAQVQVQLVSKLQDELIGTRSQLVQLRAFTPDNPQIEVLEARSAQLQREIAAEMNRVAGGGAGSLAGKAAYYQRLELESQFADRQLAGAMASLTEAHNEARRKQVYLERIVQPNLPDIAIEPRRLRGIFTTFLLGMVAWGILSMLLAGLREHQE